MNKPKGTNVTLNIRNGVIGQNASVMGRAPAPMQNPTITPERAKKLEDIVRKAQEQVKDDGKDSR